MQKWEYCFVTLGIAGSYRPDNEKYYFWINGEPYGESFLIREAGVRRRQIAERLGDEGWELVSASDPDASMIFKRPKVAVNSSLPN